jgi:hypothetical protein
VLRLFFEQIVTPPHSLYSGALQRPSEESIDDGEVGKELVLLIVRLLTSQESVQVGM